MATFEETFQENVHTPGSIEVVASSGEFLRFEVTASSTDGTVEFVDASTTWWAPNLFPAPHPVEDVFDWPHGHAELIGTNISYALLFTCILTPVNFAVVVTLHRPGNASQVVIDFTCNSDYVSDQMNLGFSVDIR